MWAACGGRKDIVDLLIEAGADVMAENNVSRPVAAE